MFTDLKYYVYKKLLRYQAYENYSNRTDALYIQIEY